MHAFRMLCPACVTLQGTPSVVLIDRQGRIRLSHFGVIDDMALGGAIGQLAAEGAPTPLITRSSGGADGIAPAGGRCDERSCSEGGD